MLRGIPTVISPELMRILMEMGHGDEICIADGNFPAGWMGQDVIRLDGHGTEEVLRAILTFFPLDRSVENPVCLMLTGSGNDVQPEIWERYHQIILDRNDKAYTHYENIERLAFYERAKQCFAVIATSETTLFANIILRKGVVE